MIVIVDYKMGNLGSVRNMILKAGGGGEISSDPERILAAQGLILPGVGRFDQAMNNLREMNLERVLNDAVLERQIPILGICLGMQIMTEGSEEGQEKGLGWIKGRVFRFSFPPERKLPVPHMGWNEVEVKGESSLLKSSDKNDFRFYFAHSYRAYLENDADVHGTTIYGESFVSALRRGNIHGVQFHPEKSHRYGMTLFRNFLEGITS